MKSLIAPILSFTMLLSCDSIMSNEDIVRSGTEKRLLENMDDPDSYEFVSLTPIDTIFVIDNTRHSRKEWELSLYRAKEGLKAAERASSTPPTKFDEGRLAIHRNSIKQAEAAIHKIDSVSRQLGSETGNIASYSFSFKFRGTNKFGAKVLSELIVQTDSAFNILNISEKANDMLTIPGDFSGHQGRVKPK